jgi:hypothetical protein
LLKSPTSAKTNKSLELIGQLCVLTPEPGCRITGLPDVVLEQRRSSWLARLEARRSWMVERGNRIIRESGLAHLTSSVADALGYGETSRISNGRPQ